MRPRRNRATGPGPRRSLGDPGPRLLSRRGSEKSTSMPPTRNTPNARPTACTFPNFASSDSNLSTPRPNTSTSMSFVRTPRRRSRTNPPTTKARPPALRTALAISVIPGPNPGSGVERHGGATRGARPPVTTARPHSSGAGAASGGRTGVHRRRMSGPGVARHRSPPVTVRPAAARVTGVECRERTVTAAR